MRLRISPTRMELIKLRKRLAIAQRGHKLLKDRQEELSRHFFELLNLTKKLREEIEENLSEIYTHFVKANLSLGDKKTLLLIQQMEKPLFSLKETRLMNTNYLKAALKEKGKFKVLIQSNEDLDKAMIKFNETYPNLLKLAESEKLMELLALELQKIRRRVNALEYVLIPSIKETIKYITEKFNEIERDNTIRLMKIKEIRA